MKKYNDSIENGEKAISIFQMLGSNDDVTETQGKLDEWKKNL